MAPIMIWPLLTPLASAPVVIPSTLTISYLELLLILQMGHALSVLGVYLCSFLCFRIFFSPAVTGRILCTQRNTSLQSSKTTSKSELNALICVPLASEPYLPTVITVYVIIANLYHST